MNSNQGQRVETVKFTFEFFKHLTTLSGAATVVVLALIERPSPNLGDFVFPVVVFGATAIASVFGMFYALVFTQVDQSEVLAFRGIEFAAFMAGMFATGLVFLLLAAFKLPSELSWIYTILNVVAGVLILRRILRS